MILRAVDPGRRSQTRFALGWLVDGPLALTSDASSDAVRKPVVELEADDLQANGLIQASPGQARHERRPRSARNDSATGAHLLRAGHAVGEINPHVRAEPARRRSTGLQTCAASGGPLRRFGAAGCVRVPNAHDGRWPHRVQIRAPFRLLKLPLGT